MGTPGVLLNITKSDIADALIKFQGCVAKVAKELKIARSTLYVKINEEPDLQQLIQDLREDIDDTIVASAQNALLYLINQVKTDAPNALKAIIYALNNKGRKLGYGLTQEITIDANDGAYHTAAQIEEGNRQRAVGRPILAAEQYLSHQERSGQQDSVPDELGTTNLMEGAS